MNIGIVTTWFERGAAYVSRQFLDVLQKDHNVYIYARGGESYGKGDPEWDKSYVTWGKSALSFAPTDVNIDHFRSWIETNELDLVFFNEQKFWAPVLLCRELGVMCGSYIDYYTEKTIPLFGIFDFLICNTLRHMSVFTWHPQCFYIPWGTDTSLFVPNDFMPVRKDMVTFFHSAGMSPYRKGTDQLLCAFESVADRAHLVIHTQVSLCESLPELAGCLEELSSKGCLTVIEKTVSAPGLYHLGDVYIYPTRLDGIGLTILEASSCGLPVVVPDNGPMNEFVKHGQNGHTVSLSKTWARWDGYYWPQCEISLDGLTAVLQEYVDRFSRLEELKKLSRNFAIEYLDWSKNSACLNELVTHARRLTTNEVDKACMLAQEADTETLRRLDMRFRQKLVCKLKSKYPQINERIVPFVDFLRTQLRRN
jgi:glycosyltransferase involved in cell wall biosynthesis